MAVARPTWPGGGGHCAVCRRIRPGPRAWFSAPRGAVFSLEGSPYGLCHCVTVRRWPRHLSFRSSAEGQASAGESEFVGSPDQVVLVLIFNSVNFPRFSHGINFESQTVNRLNCTVRYPVVGPAVPYGHVTGRAAAASGRSPPGPGRRPPQRRSDRAGEGGTVTVTRD